jgi:hypothetical protein
MSGAPFLLGGFHATTALAAAFTGAAVVGQPTNAARGPIGWMMCSQKLRGLRPTVCLGRASSTGKDAIELQTSRGPVKGRLVVPESSEQNPGDASGRARTPLRAIVPQQRIEPPRSLSE